MSMKTLQARKRKDKADAEGIMKAIQAVQMVSLLALRNQGFGAKRLKKFSEDFNELVNDVSRGFLTLSDMYEAIEDETGLTREDLTLKSWRGNK